MHFVPIHSESHLFRACGHKRFCHAWYTIGLSIRRLGYNLLIACSTSPIHTRLGVCFPSLGNDVRVRWTIGLPLDIRLSDLGRFLPLQRVIVQPQIGFLFAHRQLKVTRHSIFSHLPKYWPESQLYRSMFFLYYPYCSIRCCRYLGLDQDFGSHFHCRCPIELSFRCTSSNPGFLSYPMFSQTPAVLWPDWQDYRKGRMSLFPKHPCCP